MSKLVYHVYAHHQYFMLRVQYVKDLLLHRVKRSGEYRIRTDDLLHAMQALSQLSYAPVDKLLC